MRKLFDILKELRWILMSPINYCRAYWRIFRLAREYNRHNPVSLDLKDLHLLRVPWVLYFFPSLEIALYLSNNRISKLPKWLKKFDFYAVDLSKNRLTEFPTTILSYHNLRTCILSDNQIKEIPTQINQLQNLDILDVSYNQIIKIPETIGELKRLKTLNLSGNKLKMIPNTIGNLKDLRIFGLSGNQLIELPNEMSLLQNLEDLTLEANIMLKKLPENIGLLENLIYLNIQNTKITTLPQSIRNLQMVKDSDFLKSIPNVISIYALNLRGLDLSTEKFKIPKFIEPQSPAQKIEYILASEEERKNIKRIYLQTRLESAKKWRGLNLKNFGLEKFPFSLEELQDIPLLEIDLSYNNLTELPSFIGELKTLKVLQLNNNQLKTLPNELTQLPNLKRLSVWGNELIELPKEIGNLQQLEELSLSHNQLTTLPDSIGNLQQLQHLSLSNNEFQKLPDSIGELQQLKSLELSYKNLKVLPFSLEKLHNLEYLDLDNNQYSIWTTLRLALLKPKEKIRYLVKRQRKRY